MKDDDDNVANAKENIFSWSKAGNPKQAVWWIRTQGSSSSQGSFLFLRKKEKRRGSLPAKHL